MIYGALDLAAVSGVAWGAEAGPPKFSTWDMGPLNTAERCLYIMRRLPMWLETHSIEHCAIEAPLMPHKAGNKGTNASTALQLNGYVFLALGICEGHGVKTTLLERQAALKHFTGKSHYPEKNAAKKACLARCEMLRWPATNWDEADAGALWDMLIGQQNAARLLGMKASRPMMF